MSADDRDPKNSDEKGGSADKEMDDDRGAQGFRNNCEYVKGFLNVIKNNQCTSMSKNVKKELEDMKEEMKAFLQEQEQGCKRKIKGTEAGDIESTNRVKGEVFNRMSMAETVGGPDDGKVAYKISSARARLGDESSDQVSSESMFSDDDADDIDRYRKTSKKVSKTRYQKSESERSRNSHRRRSKQVSSARVSNSSGEESEDSVRRSREERNRSRKRRISKRNTSVDYRETPKLETFREETGQDIEKYMVKFEDYCRQNFRGSKDFWLNILEEKLEGRMLESFKVLRDPNDDYHATIKTFLKWYKDSAEYRKRKYRKKFANARQKKEESLFMFSIRLTSLFKTAYPRHNENKSKTLMKQFKQVISRSARESINTQIIACKLKNQKPDWNFIQQCIRIRDLDEEIDLRSDSEGESRKTKEVFINVSRPELQNKNERFGERRYGRQDQGHNRASRETSSSRAVNGQQRENNNNRCFTCDKPGHISSNCWRKLGLCLICGKDGHFVNECTNKRNDFIGRDSNRFNRQVRSRSYSHNRNYEDQQNKRPDDYRQNQRASMNCHNGFNTQRFSYDNNANYSPIGGAASRNDQQVSLGQTTLSSNAAEFHPRDRTSSDKGEWSANASPHAEKVSENPRRTSPNLNY